MISLDRLCVCVCVFVCVFLCVCVFFFCVCVCVCAPLLNDDGPSGYVASDGIH